MKQSFLLARLSLLYKKKFEDVFIWELLAIYSARSNYVSLTIYLAW